MCQFDHPNVIKLRGVVTETPTMIVLEYMSRGNLRNVLLYTTSEEAVKPGIRNNGISEFQLSAFFIQNSFYPCVTAGNRYTCALKCWKPGYL